ncbi:CotH kinase family protein [Candidatus Poriferisodalis sp.]|uniref:CotH kinase family protein n=1 Tax=Candidatus Poriferisodalis sp. TaxID=3101277 RepID=UPI003B01C641
MRAQPRLRLLAAALVAASLIATGCTGVADDGAPPATTLALATTAPPAAPDDGSETDPRSAYFALDRVLDISIEIDVEDWDVLRHQTRTLADVFAEIEEYGLSRPFASIYTWFSATVTVDGETHAEVGVRKKGFVGSQSSTKPSLKLRFDKYIDGQALAGGMNRMTLNNSVQDPSMLNTCLSYRVFAAAGNPAPHCNFAAVSLNGTDLGLYVHVEEFKAPFLSHHFGSAEGNLYEGTVSDFTPDFRGTFEKKTNEDTDDWSDIDAVVAALDDSSDAGLKALAEIVDLDRFLSFWATEVLVGHWDGYAGDRNNYWFYRVPDGRFVFLPWGTDGTFHLSDDPNPFDNISDPSPSVLALTAIPNRLYNHPDWRAKYVSRLKQILDDVWHETELLAAVDKMAAIVQQHALPEAARAAERDTERLRTFIAKRKAEILAALTPTPPEWPEPEATAPPTAGSGTLEVAFETTWGSNLSPNPLAQGTVHSLLLNGAPEPVGGTGVFAGKASPEERILLPGVDNPASIVIVKLEGDDSVAGVSLVVDPEQLVAGATLVIGESSLAGGVWSIPPGASTPDSFSPFTEGVLELSSGDTAPGAAIAGAFAGTFGWALSPSEVDGGDVQGGDPSDEPLDVGLIINEVAAKGDPLDWFELYNASRVPIALDGFEMADDLMDIGKRVPFPAGTVIGPGEYLQISLDKEGWPGFALGSDEELGVWLLDGTLVASVDWNEGQSGADQSYARVPDVTGRFETVDTPTPGAPSAGPPPVGSP